MKHDELIPYYNRELAYLRHRGSQFARKYPKIARRLDLQSPDAADPHVERLIEAFAFLTARIQKKLDDDFSEVAQALLGIIHPQFLAPIPSMTIVQFHLDASAGRTTDAVHVPRHKPLYSQPVGGTRCTFRTCYETDLWPISVAAARVRTPSPDAKPPVSARTVLQLDLECGQNVQFNEFHLDQLRFYLHSSSTDHLAMYEFLLNDASVVHIVDPSQGNRVLADIPARRCLQPVGFAENEGLLPYDARTLLGYRILLEYFVLPQKFLFVDFLHLVDAVKRARGNRITFLVYSDHVYGGRANAVTANMFRLGCTPAVNLFRKKASPIRLDHTHFEYRVVTDEAHRNQIETYSIESVKGISRGQSGPKSYEPFYSTSHGEKAGREGQAYWYATRKAVGAKESEGTDLYLSLVDLGFRPTLPSSEVLDVDTLCTNRDLPSELPFRESQGFFSVERVPVSGITCLLKPTPSSRVPLGKGLQWRLIAHLALNYSSFLEPQRGRAYLLEILGLYDFKQSKHTAQQIAGILQVAGHQTAARVVSENGESGIARGFDLELVLDPAAYVGSSPFLFASVVERFLGLSIAMNSFCKVRVRLRNSERYLRVWPPRAGRRTLL